MAGGKSYKDMSLIERQARYRSLMNTGKSSKKSQKKLSKKQKIIRNVGAALGAGAVAVMTAWYNSKR